MIQKTCCFTGHRRLPQNKVEQIVLRLNVEVDRLIGQGVHNFICGGAIGFDLMAASIIVYKKEIGHPVKLKFALPCRNQDALWSDKQKKLYQDLLAEADSIHYVSEVYQAGCMKKRNKYMIEQSDICVCALLHDHSGTSQTVSLARRKGLTIVNVAELATIS